MDKRFFPDWRDVVVYSEQGAQPQILVETDNYKAVIIGLAAGNKIPAHAEGQAIFHFLEGNGQVILDDAVFDVSAGATVFAPSGAKRGIAAVTKLALLAVRMAD